MTDQPRPQTCEWNHPDTGPCDLPGKHRYLGRAFCSLHYRLSWRR
jgi:hypothetical protein